MELFGGQYSAFGIRDFGSIFEYRSYNKGDQALNLNVGVFPVTIVPNPGMTGESKSGILRNKKMNRVSYESLGFFRNTRQESVILHFLNVIFPRD